MSDAKRTDRGALALADRYMPDASTSEREAAAANVREFAAVIFRVASRIAREEYDAAIRAIRDEDVQ